MEWSGFHFLNVPFAYSRTKNRGPVMRRLICLLSLVFIFYGVLANSAHSITAAFAQQQPPAKYDDWLESDGQNQRFKVRAEVFLPDGQPAEDLIVEFRYHNQPVEQKYEVEDNKVTAWLSTFDSSGFFAELFVKTKDDRFAKTQTFPGESIRQTCVTGIRIDLVPMRQIQLHVVNQDNQPIPEAAVLGYSAKTDANGNALIKIPNDEKVFRFDVLAPNGDVGQLNLTDKPLLANDDSFEIELFSELDTTKQTIRLLDEDKRPVASVRIMPQRWSGRTSFVAECGLPMKTDENGEVHLTWIPSLPGSQAFVSIFESDWHVVREERTEGLWTVNLQPLRRKQIQGKVHLPDGVKGGFHVELRSFDHPTERRADVVVVRTDEKGEFSANVLVGAYYCVFVKDSQWSSEIWDGKLAAGDGTLQAPNLKIERGLPVKIIATDGKDGTPLANAQIYLERSHRFQTATGTGRSGPQWSVTTNEEGIAYTRSAPGKLEATIRLSNYSDRVEMVVKPDAENEIRFHLPAAK